jgi:hypothetical protein
MSEREKLAICSAIFGVFRVFRRFLCRYFKRATLNVGRPLGLPDGCVMLGREI